MFQTFASRYGSDLERQMQDIVESFKTAPPDFKTMIEYPMGWANADGSVYTGQTGKRIRPILLLLCCESSGGDWRSALPAAAAVEILHNFSLVHDDIQDGSPTRHNRDTVWRVWGDPMAINVGDSMFALAYYAMERLSANDYAATQVIASWQVFNHTVLELTRGQYMDMSFEDREDVTVDEYLTMIGGKTASLIAGVAQIGALLGSGDAATAERYAEFGLNLGLAFQVRDDILDIWGNPDETGKATATDIIARKKSLPVLYGLEKSDALRKLYQLPTFDDNTVRKIVALLGDIGAHNFARGLEERYYTQAMQSLQQVKPQGEAGELLLSLVRALFGRKQ